MRSSLMKSDQPQQNASKSIEDKCLKDFKQRRAEILTEIQNLSTTPLSQKRILKLKKQARGACRSSEVRWTPARFSEKYKQNEWYYYFKTYLKAKFFKNHSNSEIMNKIYLTVATRIQYLKNLKISTNSATNKAAEQELEKHKENKDKARKPKSRIQYGKNLANFKKRSAQILAKVKPEITVTEERKRIIKLEAQNTSETTLARTWSPIKFIEKYKRNEWHYYFACYLEGKFNTSHDKQNEMDAIYKIIESRITVLLSLIKLKETLGINSDFCQAMMSASTTNIQDTEAMKNAAIKAGQDRGLTHSYLPIAQEVCTKYPGFETVYILSFCETRLEKCLPDEQLSLIEYIEYFYIARLKEYKYRMASTLANSPEMLKVIENDGDTNFQVSDPNTNYGAFFEGLSVSGNDSICIQMMLDSLADDNYLPSFSSSASMQPQFGSDASFTGQSDLTSQARDVDSAPKPF